MENLITYAQEQERARRHGGCRCTETHCRGQPDEKAANQSAQDEPGLAHHIERGGKRSPQLFGSSSLDDCFLCGNDDCLS